MEIHLPDDLQQFVRSQVGKGRFVSENDLICAALAQFRQAQTPANSPDQNPSPDLGPLWGMFRDEPDLIDRITTEAMHDRQIIPFRATTDE